MAGFDRLRDHQQEADLFRRRTIVAGLGVFVVGCALVGRLLFLQYFDYRHYTTLSNDNRVRLEAVAPTRGLIRDRDGRLLASNLPSFTLELVPERVDDLDATLERLRAYVDFDTADVKRLRGAWAHARPFEGVPLRFQLSAQAVSRLSVNRYRLPGVDIEAGLTRHYPWGRTAVHALGYVGRIDQNDLKTLDASAYRATNHIGKTGIESAYESVLHGKPGFRRVEVNVQGRVLRVLDQQAPVPGKDVRLTLDLDLQRMAERLLGPEDGAVVALDPRSGAVLALASTPTFNPNRFVNGISGKDYTALRDSPHRPLFNRALRGQYPPGSTIKPFIALNGLEADARDRHEPIYCRGYYTIDGFKRRYNDWKAHGDVDLGEAITQSCDVMFYDLAMRLGMTKMARFLRRFGFGQPTGIDLPGELGGLVPDPEWKQRTRGKPWYTGETPIHGIGQGYLQVTPVQLAAAVSQLANHGKPVRPHVLLRAGEQSPADLVPDDPGDPDDPDDPDAVGAPVVPPVDLSMSSDWDFVIDAMIGVTEGTHGTARSIGWHSPNTIAGKTGTAQVYSIAEGDEYDEDEIAKALRDHGLFIAFAPAKDPRIAVAVVVENGGGSSAATPIAQKLIDHWLAQQRAPEEADAG